MGFGARDFVHRANAAKPKKPRSPSGRRSENPFFWEKQKTLENFRKVDVKKPAGATPHGRVAFVRFGAETCATKMRAFAISGSCFLEIVEGRATLFAPKAIDERILQLKRESTQKLTKNQKKM